MNAATNNEPRIVSLSVDNDTISACLNDGRTITVPLAWSWRLVKATSEQRQRFEIIGSGRGVHWPEIDEDISAEGMLHGIPARFRRQTAWQSVEKSSVTAGSFAGMTATAMNFAVSIPSRN